jgi:hypothetical protein
LGTIDAGRIRVKGFEFGMESRQICSTGAREHRAAARLTVRS